ncbi:hypothetical protein ABQE42_10625 [Mycolicibacterium pulveris]
MTVLGIGDVQVGKFPLTPATAEPRGKLAVGLCQLSRHRARFALAGLSTFRAARRGVGLLLHVICHNDDIHAQVVDILRPQLIGKKFFCNKFETANGLLI